MAGSRRRKDVIGVVNLLIIAAVIGAISYAALVLQPPEYDAETLCLTDVKPAHTVLVIDKTDLYSPDQRQGIYNLVLAARERLDVGERLSLYELDERGRFRDSRFSLCNPGQGSQINPLYRNPARVQARYEAQFEAPLREVLVDLVEPKEAPESPILEALARLANQGSFDLATPNRRVILVSDMLQNSDLFTVYGRARGPFPDRLPAPGIVAAELDDRYGSSLRGVRIEVFLIPREGWETEQSGPLQTYWSEVFSQLGVRVSWNRL